MAERHDRGGCRLRGRVLRPQPRPQQRRPWPVCDREKRRCFRRAAETNHRHATPKARDGQPWRLPRGVPHRRHRGQGAEPASGGRGLCGGAPGKPQGGLCGLRCAAEFRGQTGELFHRQRERPVQAHRGDLHAAGGEDCGCDGNRFLPAARRRPDDLCGVRLG